MRDGAAAIDGMSACRKCIHTIELVALTGGRDAKSLDVNTHAHCLCLYPIACPCARILHNKPHDGISTTQYLILYSNDRNIFVHICS